MPIKIGGITVSGSLRSRVYGWDWFQADSGDNSYAYSGNIVRIALSQSHEAWDWNAEFAVPFLLGLPPIRLRQARRERSASERITSPPTTAAGTPR